MYTACELCDRTIFTKDWPAHKNSKKHREAEVKDKAANEPVQINGFGGDSGGYTADTGAGASAGDAWGGGDTFGTTSTADDGGWGADDFNTSSGFGGAKTGGGGGDRACYGCGQTGHQKRDCPSGGGGGGNGCFNCGETGYVDSIQE